MNQHQGKPSHVFIVNPQELVRVGIRTLLESVTDFTVIGEAGLRQDAVPLILQLKPDIVMLDLRVQDGKGIDTAKEILSRAARRRVSSSSPIRWTTPSYCRPWPPELTGMCCRTPEPKRSSMR